MASCVKCVLPICWFAAIVTVTSSNFPGEDEMYDCSHNEIYYKCADEVCYKTCDHLKSRPACPPVDPRCYKPACLCDKDTLRNFEGICVPYEQCRLDLFIDPFRMEYMESS